MDSLIARAFERQTVSAFTGQTESAPKLTRAFVLKIPCLLAGMLCVQDMRNEDKDERSTQRWWWKHAAMEREACNHDKRSVCNHDSSACSCELLPLD